MSLELTPQRLKANRENAKKAGRPKGVATIEREKAKDYIASRIGEYMPQIFEVIVAKALSGDIAAVKELFDRGFGKPSQAVDVTTKGESVNPSSPELAKLAQDFEEELKKNVKNSAS